MPHPRGRFQVAYLDDEEMIAAWARSSPSGSVEEARRRCHENKKKEQDAIAFWVGVSPPVQLHISLTCPTRTCQRKPLPGDPDVHIYPLTSQVSMRIWGNGLAPLEFYLFDLIDQNGHPIITPAGWEIVTVPKRLMPYQRVQSTERAMGLDLDALPEGEKYFVPEGVELHFTIPSERSVTVRIPRREGPNIVYHDM
jgi:hypothetical protein